MVAHDDVRRVHGRVLEPERTPHASQAHADLSQLERGDVVEAIYEGWAVPGETGDLGIDTPDHFIDKLVASGFERKKEVKQANLEDVFINLLETAKENWSFGNGIAQYA